MAVAVQQPVKVRKDPLETIAQGLQIAGSVYGIREASAKLGELDAAQERRDNEANGVITPLQRAEFGKSGFTEVPEGTDGAQKFSTTDGETIFIKPPKAKAELAPPKLEGYQDKSGRNRLGIVGPQGLVMSSSDPLAPTQPKDGDSKPQHLAGYQVAGTTDPVFVVPGKGFVDANGNPAKVEPAAKESITKPTQYQAATFGRRVEAAQNVFDALDAEGYDRTKTAEGLKSFLPSALQNDKLQEQSQAERNFVNAVLRRESGSAISKSEFDSAEKQYFPRSGDSPDVLAQKAQNRQIVLNGLRAEAGPAWDEVKQVTLVAPKKKGWESGTATAGPAEKPKSVIQNGHTYILNEKTGKYE